MKAVLFCRVSSKEQEETGYSLPAQEKYLREYAERNKLTVSKVFAVSESASGRVQRKIFNEMIGFIKQEDISVVIVETTDRLTRNFADVPTIDKWILSDEENEIHLAKEGCILNKNSKSHEWFMWRVKVATAEYYVRLLSENVKKGQKEKIAQGWLPTKPPVGYKTIGEKGHKVHVIDEDTMPLVKEMFALYATRNYSLKKLTEIMHKKGLRNANKNKIVKSRIHQYLIDPFYIGKNVWNGIEYQGNHETFIDEDTFKKVQEILRRKGTPKYRKHNHLFQGMFRCGECNGLITWEMHKGLVYGHCNHYRNCSQQVWYREDEIEKLLSMKLSLLQIRNARLAEWIRKALKEGHQDKIAYHTSTLKELTQRQEQFNKRLEKMYEDKLDGKITEAFYNEKAKKYQAELKEITSSLEKHRNANEKYYELGSNLYELSQRATMIYEKANKEDKRLLINLIFSQLTLKNDMIIANHSKAFKLLSELVVATNSSKVKENGRIVARILEPVKKPDISIQMDDFYLHRPILLPR
jgi:site-specific DNA recombinase